jgi:hypothetical protein
MRHWIATVLSKLARRTPDFTPSFRPILEQLEDRCLPSTSMMMGMPMPPMNNPPMGMPAMTMPSPNMPSMGMNMMSNGMAMNLFADVNHLFMDFDQTLMQVLASKTVQQLVMNEAHMIQVLATDLAQIRMLVGQMDGMM